MNDIELEIEKFLEILTNHYLIEKKEVIKIDQNVLADCGFDIKKDNGQFFNIICPKLRRDGILKEYSQLINPEDIIQISHDPDKYRCFFTFVVNPEKLKGKTLEVKPKKTELDKGTKNLINRDISSGDFYYKNKPIKLNDKHAIYYLIFECLYLKSDMEGFCSYDTIDNYLTSNEKSKCKTEKQKIKRINNGVANFLRFSKLPKNANNNKKLIEIIKSRGLIFNNPAI